MIEFVIASVDDARRMLHWLAKRQRTTLTSLVKGAGMRSDALVNFGSLSDETRRTNDTNLGMILQVCIGSDHRVIARPIGAKHPQLHHSGAAPLEIRAAGGGLLEIPMRDLGDVPVVTRTMEVVNNCTITAICVKAEVALGLVSFVHGTVRQKDLRLRTFLKAMAAGGFELVVQPRFANAREARFNDKIAGSKQ